MMGHIAAANDPFAPTAVVYSGRSPIEGYGMSYRSSLLSAANSRHALALMFAVMLKPYTASALVREAEH